MYFCRLQYENLRHYEQSRTTVYIARKSIADYPKVRHHHYYWFIFHNIDLNNFRLNFLM